jgi:hypothetical protein
LACFLFVDASLAYPADLRALDAENRLSAPDRYGVVRTIPRAMVLSACSRAGSNREKEHNACQHISISLFHAGRN